MQLLCAIADEAFDKDESLRAAYPQCPAARGERSATLIKYVTDRAGHDRRYAIDATKIERELGYGAAVSLETGIRETFAWYLANANWWRGVMDGSYRTWMATNYNH